MRLPELPRRARRLGRYCLRLGGAWSGRLAHAIVGSVESGVDAYDQLCRDTVLIQDSLLSAKDWLRLYSFCLRFGFFELGYELRRKARARAIAELSGIKPGFEGMPRMQYTAALVEAQQWDLVDEQLHARPDDTLDHQDAYRTLVSLLRNGRKARTTERPETEPEDTAFRHAVTGRAAAFVGPATPRRDDAFDIDRHELVVRCNDVRLEGSAPSVGKGSRCDISYYNRERVRALAADKNFSFRSGIRWAVTKDRASLRLLQQATDRVGRGASRPEGSMPTRLRASRHYAPFLFHGTLTAAPNAFLDLLEHGVDSITVFHTDLMLTVERSAGYDPAVQGRDAHIEKFIRSSAAPHDPVTSYTVLAQLYRSGWLTGDAGFVRAMDMGEARYMKRLEQLYGKYGRGLSA